MSLIVAMTVTPLLCRMMLSGDDYLDRNVKESWLTRHLSWYYTKSLVWVMNNRKKVLYPTIGLFVVTLVLFFTMGRSFLPEFNEGSLVITTVTKPGVSLEESSRLGNLMEEELLKIPEVTGTARRTGRGELDEHALSSNSSEVDVNFDLKGRGRDEFLADVRETLSEIPGLVSSVGQPLGHRIDHMLSGTKANIAIKLFGTDLSDMYLLGNRIVGTLKGIDGLVDLSVEQQTETPQLQIRANRAMLAATGYPSRISIAFIELAFAGEN